MSRLALAAAIILAAAGIVAIPGDAAAGPPTVRDRPPECVTVSVRAYQRDGSLGARTWLEFCGSGPGADSALRDSVNRGQFLLDGAYGIGHGCGSWGQPCVIFGP